MVRRDAQTLEKSFDRIAPQGDVEILAPLLSELKEPIVDGCGSAVGHASASR